MPLTKVTSDVIEDGGIVAANIADNQIDIAKLNVTDGSNGDVLTTDGAGTLSFQTFSQSVPFNITNPQVDDKLRFDGSDWVNAVIPTINDFIDTADTALTGSFFAINDTQPFAGNIVKYVGLTNTVSLDSFVDPNDAMNSYADMAGIRSELLMDSAPTTTGNGFSNIHAADALITINAPFDFTADAMVLIGSKSTVAITSGASGGSTHSVILNFNNLSLSSSVNPIGTFTGVLSDIFASSYTSTISTAIMYNATLRGSGSGTITDLDVYKVDMATSLNVTDFTGFRVEYNSGTNYTTTAYGLHIDDLTQTTASDCKGLVIEGSSLENDISGRLTVGRRLTVGLDMFVSAMVTSDPLVAGQVWNNNGVLTVSTGS